MQHPNIVAYRDSFIDSTGTLCILMEYCEHGDIFTYLREVRFVQQSPDESRLLEWFTQIVLALQSLHLKKILHRDLKTQNIFLTGDRQQGIFAAKLGDFGIAKVLNSTVDLAKTQIGTPFYMSPEIINSHPYSYKSDVWGLGCVLYEIVNDQRAFDAQSLNGLALKIIKGSYEPMKGRCSQTVKQVIEALLSKSPAHRPSLKEILHMPSIRPRIPLAIRSSVAAGPAEARPAIEQALSDQLVSLGLGRLVNGPAGPRRNQKRLLERLQRAQHLQHREEQVLQQTNALLAQYLRDPSQVADDAGLYGASGAIPSAPSAPRAPPPPAPLASPRRAGLSSDESQDEKPMLSHRERVRQKERRREDTDLRFQEEARTLREPRHQSRSRPDRRHRSTSNLGPEDAGRSKEVTRSRARTEDAVLSQDQDGNPGRSKEVTRSRARTEDLVSSQDQELHLSSVSWLLEYDHVQPENLANPFQQCRQSVVHSPNQQPRHRRQVSEPNPPPQPPPLSYGPEPLPPNNAPPAASGARSWRTADGPFRAGQPARTPIHSVYLEALDGPERKRSEYSEAEGFQDSASSGGSNLSDNEYDPFRLEGDDADGRTARQRSLEERIDESKAAIYKYRMTIDMLQYSFEHGEDAVMTDRSVLGPSHSATGIIAAGEEVHALSGTRRQPPAPGIVQDCCARLLRRCLEGIGSEKLQAARHVVQNSLDAAELPSSLRLRMLDLLGSEKIGFLSLIDQLVYMERRWGMQDLA